VLHRSGVAAGAGASMGWRTTESYTGSGLGAIWAASRDLAWVSGNDGALQRWDGGRFWNIPQRETTAGLLSIHAAASGNSLWAVGERGTLLRWNGVYWEPTWIDSVETVRDVWSDGPDRAWAVGGNGLLLRWDGSRWLRLDSGERTELMALFGVDAAPAPCCTGTVKAGCPPARGRHQHRTCFPSGAPRRSFTPPAAMARCCAAIRISGSPSPAACRWACT
jgi:hypothetical protein